MEAQIDFRMTGLLRLRTQAFRQREDDARRIIEQALTQGTTPAGFVSGGIDSVAMAGILAQVTRCPLWAHVSDASFPGTRETLAALAQVTGLEVIVHESERSAFTLVTNATVKKFGKKGVFFTAIQKYMEASGCDVAFVGVRAAESPRRSRACRAHGAVFASSVPIPHTKCFPLAWMTIEDVAAVIEKYGLPLHPIYSKIPMGTARIRLGYVTARDLLEKGTAVFLRINYPEIFNRLAAVYPDVRQYV